MLDDVDASGEKAGVGRAFAAALGVVDIEAVDADEGDALRNEVVHPIRRQKWRTRHIGRLAEVAVPTGVQQHRLARDVTVPEHRRRDAPLERVVEVKDLGRLVNKSLEREAGEVGCAPVAVKRAVEVVPVLPIMVITSNANSVPGAYFARESERVRYGVITGAGRPG